MNRSPSRARPPRQRPRPPLRRWLAQWSLRMIKIALVGLTTCGLGWVWLAMYLYYERFKRRRLPASGPLQR